MNKEIFLECDCYSEGIRFNYDEDGMLNISLYQRGFAPRTRSWKEKLRWIWQIIRKDVPYDDEIILSKEKINLLAQFVNDILPNKALKKGTLYKLRNEDFAFRYLGEQYNMIENQIYHRFKHHQVKEVFILNESLIEREANPEEIRIYNLLKKK
jgi:hypothetical protein